MSSIGNEPEGGEVRVEDEEGIVDRKTKEHILALRKQIDEDERRLYVELVATGEVDKPQADQFWGVSVRQYLRGIKRLWNDENIEESSGVKNVEYYWKSKPIDELRIPPPDKRDYPFSRLANSAESPSTIKRELGLPRSAELPQPKRVEFRGLESVLNTHQIRKQWSVKVSDRGPAPAHEHMYLERVLPVPKTVLEQAVETADNFLQQAGVGFETTVPPYMGGDEPGL